MHWLACQRMGKANFLGVEHEAFAGLAGAVEGVSYNRKVEAVNVAGVQAQLVGAAGLGHE